MKTIDITSVRSETNVSHNHSLLEDPVKFDLGYLEGYVFCLPYGGKELGEDQYMIQGKDNFMASLLADDAGHGK